MLTGRFPIEMEELSSSLETCIKQFQAGREYEDQAQREIDRLNKQRTTK